MFGSEFWDVLNKGISDDDSFNNILNILDFPMESLEEDDGVAEDLENRFQALGTIPPEAFMGFPLASKRDTGTGTSNKPLSSSFPNNGNSQPEHQPRFVKETSGTKIPLQDKKPVVFQAPSPSSVLERSSSSSAEKSRSISSDVSIPARTRSKRPRSSSFNSWFVMPSLPFTSKNSSNPEKLKDKKKNKLSVLSDDKRMEKDSYELIKEKPNQKSGAIDTNKSSLQRQGTIKKCTHCEVSKTPQWREGPMGPKTLCNACGVRYRSGRLFPEYRPAVSPTFVPSLHSNSHKKVIEMREKTTQKAPTPEKGTAMSCNPEFVIEMRKKVMQDVPMDEIDPEMSPPPEFVPMSSYLFD